MRLPRTLSMTQRLCYLQYVVFVLCASSFEAMQARVDTKSAVSSRLKWGA
jgi:hypothetical protein